MGIRGASAELVAAAAGLILIGRLLDGPVAWLLGALLVVAVALAAVQLHGESDSPAAVPGVPVESVVSPAAAAGAVFMALHLVPIGLLLVPGLVAGVWLVSRVLATEARILAATSGPSGADRTAILVQALVIGFLGFAGIAGLVPGGLPEPGAVAAPAPTGTSLAALAVADAGLAFLLGYRSAALRSSNLRDVAWFAMTGALVVAIAAVALRAMEIPRFLGPALLVLVFYLWDAVHAGAPSRRRDPRRLWEVVLLAILGLVVVAWGLRLQA